MSDDVYCGSGGGANTYTGLRIASIFIIWATSSFGATFPTLARRSKYLSVPKPLFEFAKYFGSGVIIATAFIHLLQPGYQELTSPCLSEAWQIYPYAFALALLSIFSIFIVELVAFRWGSSKLAKLGITHDPHGHNTGAAHAAHGPETNTPRSPDQEEAVARPPLEKSDSFSDEHSDHKQPDNVLDKPSAQVLGIFILEFGVVLHSILIGLTLAVDPDFKILFVVIIFHQMFEGLGLGSRLSTLNMPHNLRHVPILAGLLYGITTPIGIAAGLGIRSSYNPNTPLASIVSGVLDSLSAGILVYTGLVELLAHEFLFNPEMINASNGKLAYSLGCMLLGCGIMALLGRWA